MRITGRWRDHHTLDDLRTSKRLEGSGCSFSKMTEFELCILLLMRVYPQGSLDLVPGLLSGHWDLSVMPDEHRAWIARVRQQVSSTGQASWRQSREAYAGVPADLRLFAVATDGHPQQITPAVSPQRIDAYVAVMTTPPPYENNRKSAGYDTTYSFWSGDHHGEVKFPKHLLNVVPNVCTIPPSRPGKRQSRLNFTWDELLETASCIERMDSRGRDWHKHMERARLVVQGVDDAVLCIEDIYHLVGMIGTGKSTLMQVLAVHLAHRNMRTLLIVGDTVQAMSLASFLKDDLKLPAAPILGTGNRPAHYRNIMNASDHPHEMPTDSRLRWLGDGCLLPHLGDGYQADFIPQPGLEPCRGLQKESTPERFLCPLMPVCPVHRTRNGVMDALIWVATLPSLLHTPAPERTVQGRMRMLDLAFHSCDLIVHDECDKGQTTFDEAFSPSIVLTEGGSSSGIMEDHLRRVAPARQAPRPIPSDWRDAIWDMQKYVERLISLGREHYDVSLWLQGSRLEESHSSNQKRYFRKPDWFTPYWLFERMWNELAQLDSSKDNADRIYSNVKHAWNKETQQFLSSSSPLASINPPSEIGLSLKDVAEQALYTTIPYTAASLKTARRWLRKYTSLLHFSANLDLHALSRQLTATVLVVLLDNRLHNFMGMKDAMDASGQPASVMAEGMDMRLPVEYLNIVPKFPMGPINGFVWDQEGQEDPISISYFRCTSVGRWLQTHLHNFLTDLEGEPGPHVLLMSGTSWAPSSPSHHVEAEPNGLLMPPALDLPDTVHSGAILDMDHAISVSGSPNKRQSLHQLCSYMAPLLQRELDLINEQTDRVGRLKAMCVTASYDQAQDVGEELAQQGFRVATLIPDGNTDRQIPTWSRRKLLARGDVHRFASMDEDVLVVPLLAIERGHNIVHPDGKAAIASIWFMVRPLPPPDDIHISVRFINAWFMMNRPQWDATTCSETLTHQYQKYREQAWSEWQDIQRRPGTWQGLKYHHKQQIASDQLIVMLQAIGRGMRGGCSVRVHIVDAAFTRGKSDSRNSLYDIMVDTLQGWVADRTLGSRVYVPFTHILPSPKRENSECHS